MSPPPATSPNGARADGEITLTERIEDDIYLGELAPGTWLKQVELEARYRAPRLALRQALEAMATKGLINHQPNRGFYVPQFDDATIEQVSNTRAVLEMAASAEVVGRHGETDHAEMERWATAFHDAIENGTAANQESANIQFHRAMLAPCPNRVMVDLIFELRHRLPIAVTRRANTVQRLRRAAEDHFNIIAALRAGDAEGLRSLMWTHVARVGSR